MLDVTRGVKLEEKRTTGEKSGEKLPWRKNQGGNYKVAFITT